MPPRKPESPTKPKTKKASEGIAPTVVVSEEPKPRGRPTEYTPELASEVCARLANGETLRQICRSEHIPPESTVRQWAVDDREGFAAHYARARDLCLESWADEVLEISDDATNDWMKREGKDSEDLGWSVNGDHVSRSRLRIDSRKWLLSKLKPERYGDKIMHAGHDGGAMPQPAIYVSTTPARNGSSS